jgi:predicted Rossmann-fold nucleotide-binding protein
MKSRLPVAAVIGTSRPSAEGRAFESACRRLGDSLPIDAIQLATGACGGFPDLLAGAFLARGGSVTGYSPAENFEDHVGRWASPGDGYTELRFGFGGLLERQVAMLREADLVIAVGGNIGTLSELCMAVKLERPMLIVRGFPGVSSLFPELVAKLDPYPKPRIGWVDPDDFCRSVLAWVRRAAA